MCLSGSEEHSCLWLTLAPLFFSVVLELDITVMEIPKLMVSTVVASYCTYRYIAQARNKENILFHTINEGDAQRE